MRSGRRQAGFSFVEAIVVLVITAVLGTVLYRTFSGGLVLWARGARDRGEWKAELFLNSFTSELRNVFKDPKWPFQGAKNELYFSSLSADGAIRDKTDSQLRPVYFRYLFDGNKKALGLQKFKFEDVFAPEPRDKNMVAILNRIRNVSFEYYAYDPDMKVYAWLPTWEKEKDCFPETVRVTIEYEEEPARSLTRVIDLPSGAVCQK